MLSLLRFRHAAWMCAAALAACTATPPQPVAPIPPPPPPPRQAVYAVTARGELVKFAPAQPGQILDRKRLLGLPDGQTVVGIDFRRGRGALYALSSAGRLYTVDTTTGILLQVGMAPSTLALAGDAFGFDFNSAIDRFRVVSASGQHLRLHPDTGSVVDADAARPGVQGDAPLAYAANDPQQGRIPAVASVASTYDPSGDDTRVTHYGIDRALGTLVVQGSRAGEVPAVSPDTGLLRTVGPLGMGALESVAFDIGDSDTTALAAVRTPQDPATRLIQLDLATGLARVIGTVGTGGEALVGLAIEP